MRKPVAPPTAPPGLARFVRERLDAAGAEPPTLEDLARELDVHPSQVVRAFHRAYGLPPHRYLTSRRVDLARSLLVEGHRPEAVAAQAGFHDQAHLTRHFRRVLGTIPARFARGGPA